MKILQPGQGAIKKLRLEELRPILPDFRPLYVSAKTTLLEPGGVSEAIWYVDSGILRSYTIIEDEKRSSTNKLTSNREITNWIVSEGGFLTDIRSFLYRAPTLAVIETLEDCTLYKLSYENYLSAHKFVPDLTRVLFENTLLLSESRVQMCSLRNPLHRLEMFERLHPNLTGRISLGIQASYLNMDRATLSRIRGKYR